MATSESWITQIRDPMSNVSQPFCKTESTAVGLVYTDNHLPNKPQQFWDY